MPRGTHIIYVYIAVYVMWYTNTQTAISGSSGPGFGRFGSEAGLGRLTEHLEGQTPDTRLRAPPGAAEGALVVRQHQLTQLEEVLPTAGVGEPTPIM